MFPYHSAFDFSATHGRMRTKLRECADMRDPIRACVTATDGDALSLCFSGESLLWRGRQWKGGCLCDVPPAICQLTEKEIDSCNPHTFISDDGC
jgi:hypothetical protein